VILKGNKGIESIEEYMEGCRGIGAWDLQTGKRIKGIKYRGWRTKK
jgi:pimeloyl-CoA synthetase